MSGIPEDIRDRLTKIIKANWPEGVPLPRGYAQRLARTVAYFLKDDLRTPSEREAVRKAIKEGKKEHGS